MDSFFKSLSEGYRAALSAYISDIKQLIGIERRLIGQLKASRGEDAKCKTLVKQIDGVQAGVPTAEAKFLTAVDSINESIVMRFRAICSLPVKMVPTAGTEYLLQECKEFDAAKGDFKKRQECYDSIVTVAEAVAGSLTIESSDGGRETVTRIPDRSRPKVGQAQIDIYEQFMSMEDGEGKGAYYNENNAVILAVEDLKRLR